MYSVVILAQQQGQINLFPDCDTIREIKFDVEKILASNNRSLFEPSLDSTLALYCYAQGMDNPKLEAYSLYALSHAFDGELRRDSVNFKKIFTYIDQCIKICEANNFYQIELWAKEKLCSMFTGNRMFAQANLYADEIMELAMRLDDSLMIAENLMLKGRIKREEKEFQLADSLLKRAINFHTNTPESNRITAFSYLHISDLKRLQKDYRLSIKYAHKGFEYAEKSSSQIPFLKALLANEIALCNVEIGKYDNEELLNTIAKIKEHHPWIAVELGIIKGRTFQKQGMVKEAIQAYFSAMSYAQKKGRTTLALDISKELFPLLRLNKEFSPLTLEYYNTVTSAYNVMLNQNGSDNLLKLTYENLTQEKETSTILQAELKNSYLLIMLAIGAIIIIGLLALLAYSYSKKNKEFAEHELAFRKMRDNLFANLSHEFRTPLTVLKTSLKDMRSNDFEGSYQDYAEMMYRNTKNLANLTEQMLDLAKMSEQSLVFKPVEVEISSYLNLLLVQLSALVDHKQISLNFTAPVTPLTIQIDKHVLHKIVQNLVFNAIKFTPKKGRINLSLKIEEKYFKIIVTDSGGGIAQDKLPHIFDRYFRDVMESNRLETGGLGLALVKQLIDLQSGTIEVESKIGKGTTFLVALPHHKLNLNQSHYSSRKTTQISMQSFTLEHHEKIEDDFFFNNYLEKDAPIILVVEDNPDLNFILFEKLRNHYRVIRTYNGKEALERLHKEIPDLILTDIMMPEMNGIEFVENIMSDINYSHIPVIVLSALESTVSDMKLWKDGIIDFINKPYDIEILKYKIENQLKSRQEFKSKLFDSDWNTVFHNTTLNSIDKEFLSRLKQHIEENLGNSEASVEKIGQMLTMSRSGFYNKVKSLTGYSPTIFIRKYRLNKAKLLLLQNKGSITEIAHRVGYFNLSQFSRIFKEEFGASPRNFIKQNRKNLISN